MRPGRSLRLILSAAALVLLLPPPALAEPPPAPPREDTPAVPEPSDYQAPDPRPTPQGSPADQALWKRAMDDSNGLTLAKATSSKLQWRAHIGKYDVALAERAKGLPVAQAERLNDLARRVQAAWTANQELSNTRWPVDPTRGCQYQAQLLESTMLQAEGPERSAMLVPARADVTRCAELAESVLRQMNGLNVALEKALAEADAVLARPAN